ncbi:MAG: response regulator [Anaerolineae bacterium]|jgi:CheY-like chemotaxis protein|nr:response regulator [Anaerolineae bacterium]MBT3713798.1 response regulator [Anaerolineae bacterium]MBT4308923.1 response regulator [Anaerolineae bacterium]MBT4459603.1 response regulator [Anaerolineae bacterium]MBT4841640.1 response regulator [Anaerolineae bacterium]
MEGISNIISSVATILWPLIVIVILILFRKSVQALIESARGRKFTVKIGEMELSMDEFSKQQGDMIKDLQNRVNELQRKIEAKTDLPVADSPKAEELSFEERRVEIRREADVPLVESMFNAEIVTLDIDDDISDILWVDDNPRNNAFLIDSLHNQGISVSTAANTNEALERFKRGTFDCVISDSCRHEGKEVDNCQAGFELSSAIRELNEDVPIYIYTDEVDEKMKEKAHNVGATAITSSPSELLKLLSD